ncbi:cell growth-regulating nucleolar protein [Nymphalis io]|uniref:cell growth-regulating nucleolar protein n=1 Tax=Inachis io TaxID=171585 RepID=UPI00216A4501|nr:cell growth-regulating nucleolar protein [Nymphalis io]
MVVFTCGHCGESVQKPKVEKHYLTKCRNKNPNLSCMDCFKDFLGNDYEAHTKCITEEERYSGKGFTPKEKKGEKKQNAWVEMLQSVLDEQKNASGNVLRIIETISKHNNTPRKKPKFINFVKNVCGQKTNPKDIDQAWDLISVKLSELSNLNSQNKNKNEQDKTDVPKVNGSAGKEQNGNTENGVTNHEEDEEEAQTDEKDKKDTETKNGDSEDPNKKLSKKQRKEEKKRKKYEAELQSAEAPPPEVTQEEIQVPKKGKKNKNKIENSNGHKEENGLVEGKDKNKKRKRQDTATTIEVIEAVNNADIENVQVKVKATKKKLKMEGELATAEADESICLHDQNVAKSEHEVSENNGKFNWHAVIMSVLQKKGNELPFKRLQKKVLSEYSEYTGNEVDDRIADKFIKKLRSAPNVRVDKNRVLLLEEDE